MHGRYNQSTIKFDKSRKVFEVKNTDMILSEVPILKGMINNPIFLFLLEYYMQIFGNKWSIIS